MKIAKEKIFVVIILFFLLSYLLETIIKPINIQLSSPYSFLNLFYITKYPFTSFVIAIRAISLFLIPLLLILYFKNRYFLKLVFLLSVGILSQLLSIQVIISGNTNISIEWALSLSIAGALLIIPLIYVFLKGTIITTKNKLTRKDSVLNKKIKFDEI